MNYVLKSLLMCLFLLKGLVSWADDCVVDGIYYELDADKKEACVKPCGDGRYQGQVIIPSSIQVEGIDYTVTSIGEKAFDNCNRLYSISIPNSVTSIRRGSFSFSGLVAVTIPASVKTIGQGVFDNCNSLKKINVSDGNKYYCSIDGNLYSKDKTVLMLYPAAREGDYTIATETKTLIAGCKNSIIPTDGSVTNIGQSAFSGSSTGRMLISPLVSFSADPSG